MPPVSTDHDYYAILGLPPSASTEELRRAFRTKALTAHPDRGGSPRQMRTLTQAWDTLRDPALRAAYDAQHGFAKSGPAAAGHKRPVRRKKGPRPRSLAQVAGSLLGRAFRALAGWGAPKPKPKRRPRAATAQPRAAIIRPCKKCGQKLRIKPSATAKVVCPKCKTPQPAR